MFRIYRRDGRMRTVQLAFAAIVAVTIGAGAALAAIPDAGGVIHGCYDQTNGKLRVIDTASGGVCKSGEAALDWNQRGVQGPQGPAGPAGPQGPAGPAASVTALPIFAHYQSPDPGVVYLGSDGLSWTSDLLPPGWEGVISISAQAVSSLEGYWVCNYGYQIGTGERIFQETRVGTGLPWDTLAMAGNIGIPSAASESGRLWVNCKANTSGDFTEPYIMQLDIRGYVIEATLDWS